MKLFQFALLLPTLLGIVANTTEEDIEDLQIQELTGHYLTLLERVDTLEQALDDSKAVEKTLFGEVTKLKVKLIKQSNRIRRLEMRSGGGAKTENENQLNSGNKEY